jgi:hypothetical protein
MRGKPHEEAMEFDKESILEAIRKRGGDDQKAAEELPDKVDHEQHGDLLKRFGIDDPGELAKSVQGRIGL